ALPQFTFLPILRWMSVRALRTSVVSFMSNALPKVLLIAIVGIITFSGCYQQPSPTEQATAYLTSPVPRNPVPLPQYKPIAPQLPDSALFPIVNIYGELRPAIYRSGEGHASLSF